MNIPMYIYICGFGYMSKHLNIWTTSGHLEIRIHIATLLSTESPTLRRKPVLCPYQHRLLSFYLTSSASRNMVSYCHLNCIGF